MEINVKEVRSLDHVACWTDRFITVQGWICLLSLFGSATRVNTLKAIILKGEPVYLQNCWTWDERSQVQKPDVQVKTITRQVAPGVTHCLLYMPNYLIPNANGAQKVFWGDTLEQIFQKFFYVAQARYSTPLLPDWTEWLWDQMLQVQDINALGFDKVVGVQFLEEAELEERLFEAGAPLGEDVIAVND